MAPLEVPKVRFANSKKNWLSARRLFGERKENGTALAERIEGASEHAFDHAHDDPGDRTIQIPTTGDPTQRLLTALGRFQRQVARAESGAAQDQWVDECMNQLIVGIELANAQEWDDVMEALTDTARVLASYENARQADQCVRFLQDSYEILCLMVGDLIVDNMRSGVMDKWRARFRRAVEDLAAVGIELISDEDDHEEAEADTVVAHGENAIAGALENEDEDEDFGPAPWEAEQALHPETPQRPALRILERDEAGQVEESVAALDEIENEEGLVLGEEMYDNDAPEEEAPFEDPLEDHEVEVTFEDELDEEDTPLPLEEVHEAPLAAQDRSGLLDEPPRERETSPAAPPAMEDDLFSSAQQSLFDEQEAGTEASPEEIRETTEDSEMLFAPEETPEAEPETIESVEEELAETTASEELPEYSESEEVVLEEVKTETVTPIAPEEHAPDSPEALLSTTQRAISAGNVADAKLLALELAARMARMEAERAMDQVADCEGRIAQTHEAISRAQLGVADCEQTVHDTESRAAERSKDREARRGEVNSLQGELDTIDGRINDIDAQIRSLQEQRAEAVTQREAAQASYSDAEASAGLVQAEVDALQDAARVAQERLDAARDDVRHLEETQRAYEKELESTRRMGEQRAKSVEEITRTIESVRAVMAYAGGTDLPE